MNQSSCCCGDSEFMDAAYCYYYPNRRCVKNDCGACPYTVSVLSQDVEDCFCNSSALQLFFYKRQLLQLLLFSSQPEPIRFPGRFPLRLPGHCL